MSSTSEVYETKINSELYTEDKKKLFTILNDFIPKCNNFTFSFYPLHIVLKENLLNCVCYMCNKILNYEKYFYINYSEYKVIKYCLECYSELNYKPNLELVDTEDINNYIIINYNNYSITHFSSINYILNKNFIVSLSPVENEIRKLDKRVALSETGTLEWINLMHKIDCIPNNFGSLRRWAAFSDIYEIPFIPIDVILLVDTVDNRISLGIFNKKYKSFYLSLVVVYNNIDSFFRDKYIWINNKVPGELVSASLTKIHKESCYSYKNLINLVTDFGGYLAFSNKFTKKILKKYVNFKK